MAREKSGGGASGGVGFFGLLFIVLLVMKLAKIGEVAHWSWLWVTAPLWGGAILIILVLAIIFFILTRK